MVLRTFSPARAWRPAVVARLAQTLGVTNSMSLPSLILFDCDGVLVDSERLSHSVLREMIAEYGVNLTLEQTLDHFMSPPSRRVLKYWRHLLASRLQQTLMTGSTPAALRLSPDRSRLYLVFRSFLQISSCPTA